MSAFDYAANVALLDVDDAQKQALVARDGSSLSELLGGRTEPMMLAQWAPDSEPLRRDDDQQEGDEPSQDPTPDSDEIN